MAKFNCMKDIDPDEVKYENPFGVTVSLSRKDYDYYIEYYLKKKWYIPEFYWLKDNETIAQAKKFIFQELGSLIDRMYVKTQHRRVTAGLPSGRIGSRNGDRCTDDDLVSSPQLKTSRW